MWEAIVSNDDVCFKHILPKLNGTDIKFLYGVNSETRALIKRSKPLGTELKRTFKIAEMSSISTLEFAWENRSLWPKIWEESNFYWRVARTNKLELLRWAREEKKCEWSGGTIETAAWQGNLEMVKYCVANQCPVDSRAFANASYRGHLEIIKYLHEEVKVRWCSFTAASAADNGHLHILEYLVERKYDQFEEDACRDAAKYGHLDCLKYLHETAKAPWDAEAVRGAHLYNEPECLQYLLDNDCPLPDGWRYEHGVLYSSESESESESDSEIW